jgi:murein DD-endopeptidase MepM/ murein hydrolase activator NlpD
MIWPTPGRRITQYYSWSHQGLDIGDKIGTPLYAADDGVVIIAQGGWNGGYGNTILLDHGGGKRTRYGHASKLFVKVGDEVKKGETIAAMGSTGRSTGPHLHFEVLVNGTRYNPLNYIK